MQKLTIICGPTAIGKTTFALSMAKKYGVDLISVDSRQVYKGMNIGTGKDLPKDSHFFRVSQFTAGNDTYDVGYYLIEDVKLWLYDIAKPTQSVSSAVFKQAFDLVLKQINLQENPPILIGGTGYYLKSIINPPETMTIPPNQQLRDSCKTSTVSELQQQLKKINNSYFVRMNHSDQNNPHRLIRAIEISSSKKPLIKNPQLYDVFGICLTAPLEIISSRISERVLTRVNQDFATEISILKKEYPLFKHSQASNSLGYQEWDGYLSGKWTEEEAINQWINTEVSYAKRQLTWFKKQPNLIWFDITEKTWYAQASEQLKRWLKNG